MSMTFDKAKPTPTPTSVDAVNYETLLPDISPILFLLANWTLMLALEAADKRKQIFFPAFAIEASVKK
jgi:hypothetical protein